MNAIHPLNHQPVPWPWRALAALLALIALGSLAPALAAPVLDNGGFEAGALAPWATGGDSNFAGLGSAKLGGSSFRVELKPAASAGPAGPIATLSQSFTLAAAGALDWAFDWGAGEAFCQCDEPIRLALYIDATQVFEDQVGNIVQDRPNFMDLDRHGAGTSAVSAGAHTLRFEFQVMATSSFGRAPFASLDGVDVQLRPITPPPPGTVPEPGVAALVLLGLGLTALRRRTGAG